MSDEVLVLVRTRSQRAIDDEVMVGSDIYYVGQRGGVSRAIREGKAGGKEKGGGDGGSGCLS